MQTDKQNIPLVADIAGARERLSGIVETTPLNFNRNLSDTYGARIYLKREDLQVVRSYKIRGAYNKISALNEAEKSQGVVCASAGNHAQGVAYACRLLDIHGTIFMPTPTPGQKVAQVKNFGGDKLTLS